MEISKESFSKLNLQEIIDYLVIFGKETFGNEYSDINAWIADVYRRKNSFTAPVADLLIQINTPSDLYLAASYIMVMPDKKITKYAEQLNLTGTVADQRLRLNRFLRLSGGLNDDMKPVIPYDRYNAFIFDALKRYQLYEEDPKRDIDFAALTARVLTYRGLGNAAMTPELRKVVIKLNILNAIMNRQIHLNNFQHKDDNDNVREVHDIAMFKVNIKPGEKLVRLIDRGFVEFEMDMLHGAFTSNEHESLMLVSVVIVKTLLEENGNLNTKYYISIVPGSVEIEQYLKDLEVLSNVVDRAEGEPSAFGNILPDSEFRIFASRIAKTSGQGDYFKLIMDQFLYILPEMSSSDRDMMLIKDDIEMPKYEFHLAALLKGIPFEPETYDLAARTSLLKQTDLVDFWFQPVRFAQVPLEDILGAYYEGNDDEELSEQEKEFGKKFPDEPYDEDEDDGRRVINDIMMNRSAMALKNTNVKWQDIFYNKNPKQDDETSHGWHRRDVMLALKSRSHYDNIGKYYRREDLGLSDEFPEKIYHKYFYYPNGSKEHKLSRTTIDMLYRMLFKKDIKEKSQKSDEKVVGLSAKLPYELRRGADIEQSSPFREMTPPRTASPPLTMSQPSSTVTPVGTTTTFAAGVVPKTAPKKLTIAQPSETPSWRQSAAYQEMMSQRYPGTVPTSGPVTTVSPVQVTPITPTSISPVPPRAASPPPIQTVTPFAVAPSVPATTASISPQSKRAGIITIPGIGPKSGKNILTYPDYDPPLVFLSRGDIANYSADFEKKLQDNPTNDWYYDNNGNIILYDPPYQSTINNGYLKDGYAEIQEGANGFGILGRLGNPDSYTWVHIMSNGFGMRVYPPKNIILSQPIPK